MKQGSVVIGSSLGAIASGTLETVRFHASDQPSVTEDGTITL
jgi:hypothetical protein